MQTRQIVVLLLPLFVTAVGCTPGDSTTGGGTGGSSATGTGARTGGSGGSGATGSGGSSTTGTGGSGTTGSGGGTTAGSGGGTVTGTGGSSAGSGGRATGSGGSGSGGSTTGSGGSTTGSGGRGGSVGSGGAVGTGGRVGSGGTTGTGGAQSSMGCDIWVADTGNDSAAGTEAAPMRTFQAAYDKLCPPPTNASGTVPCMGTSPNWSLCFKSGRYAMNQSMYIRSTRSGTQAKTLKIYAAPNATTRPILDFTTQPRIDPPDADPENVDRGIKVNSDWTHVRGFEVMKANDNGIHIMGANNVVENCVVHDNDDTGIQIGTNTSAPAGTSGINNTVLNCDSYHNYDAANGGENADGFGAKEASGTGNRFIGCRAWENADDGYDFYGWTSQIVLQNCWALRSAMNSAFTGDQADGNGFKLGASEGGGGHSLMNCSAWDNKKTGFTRNSGSNSTCTGCTSCNNAQADDGVSGISSGGCPTSRGMTPRNMDGTIP